MVKFKIHVKNITGSEFQTMGGGGPEFFVKHIVCGAKFWVCAVTEENLYRNVDDGHIKLMHHCPGCGEKEVDKI
jgi:hypothetical protein